MATDDAGSVLPKPPQTAWVLVLDSRKHRSEILGVFSTLGGAIRAGDRLAINYGCKRGVDVGRDFPSWGDGGYEHHISVEDHEIDGGTHQTSPQPSSRATTPPAPSTDY